MKGRKSAAVFIFLGALLTFVFAFGLVVQRNPGALSRQYRYDLALEHFRAFCANYWLPAGIIGIPMFLVSLIVSLVREKHDSER
jgi:hypothetical protein